MFRAFRSRNYRLFFAGQGLAFTGMWMQQVAMGWLVYRLTNSTLMLGLVAFAGLFPSILTAPFAGLACDRFEKRKIIMAADIVLALSAFVLAALSFTGVIKPWHIIAVSVVMAAAGGFEMTTRHSFVPEIVPDKGMLFNAISLNSALFNIARLVGPVLAGVIVTVSGEGACFMAYGIGNMAAILAVFLMRIKPKKDSPSPGPLKALAEGAKYVMEKKPVYSTMTVVFLACFFGLSPFVLLPVVAGDILGGGPDTLGLLTGSMGVGAVIGAFVLAAGRNTRKLPFYQFVSLLVLGCALAAMFFARSLAVAVPFLAACGFGMIVFLSSNNTAIQSLAIDRVRGRVTSFYIMTFSAAAPLGSLFAGWLAKIWTVPAVFIACGAATLAIAAWFYLFVMKDAEKALVAAGKIRPAAVIEEI